MVDATPEVEYYYTDRYQGYLDVIYPGKLTISTIRMTPSRWKVSTLICAIISQHWHDGADAFPENWKISRRFLLFLFRPATVLDYRKTAIAPVIRGVLFLFPSLTAFNAVFGLPSVSSGLTGTRKKRYNKKAYKTHIRGGRMDYKRAAP